MSNGHWIILTLAMWVFPGMPRPVFSQGVSKSDCIGEVAMLSKEQENSKTILAIFRSIEERNNAQFQSYIQLEFEIHWPLSLPYGGAFRGLEPQPHGWGATWQP